MTNNLLSFDPLTKTVLFPQITTATIDGSEVQTVNMRELHEKLGVKMDFSDWVKSVLDGFEQGSDYEVFPVKRENGGRPRIEYVATLDVGKHAAMLSRSEKGKQLRQYFIDFEKQGRTVSTLPVLSSEELIAAIAANAAKQAKELAETKALALNSAERIQQLEDQRATSSVHYKEAPLGWNIKSRQIDRLLKGMVIERGRKVRLSAANYEHIFDHYAEQLFTGRTCDNPNANVLGNRPCALYDDKTVNDFVRTVLTRARRLEGGSYEHKAIPHTFKFFEVSRTE